MIVTVEKLLADLEQVRVEAMEAGAFAPALRAIELMGRAIGMWAAESASGTDLAQLVAETPDRSSGGPGGGAATAP